jgi:uncharacterized protein (TIGR00369 family)
MMTGQSGKIMGDGFEKKNNCRELDPSEAARIRESFANQSMMRSLGAGIEALGAGICRVAAPIGPGMLQQMGFAHAGATFAIGDSAAGYAAMSVAGPENEVVTSEMKIHLLAPAKGDRLVAEGRVIRAGRRLIVVQSDVFAETGDGRVHVALMTGTIVPVPL